MALSLYFCMEKRWMGLAVVGILLGLTRPDTGLWLLVLGIHILWVKRGQPKRDLAAPLGVFLAGVLSWLLFSKLYYGRALPQSLAGKAASHGVFASPNLRYALQFLSAFVPAQRFGLWGLAIITMVLLALLVSTLHFWRHYPDLRPVVYFFPFYVAVFLGCRTPLFSWYSIPAKWAFYLLATYWIWWVAQKAAAASRLQPRLAMALLAACVAILGVRAVADGLRKPQPNTWLAVSDFLDQKVHSNGSIFLEHIGLVGYRTHRYLYDYGGLVTPETVRLRRQYGPGWLPKAARAYHADAVVLYGPDRPSVERADDADAVWFQNAYQHVKDYQSEDLAISVYFMKNSPRVSLNPN
jgi:hypothetical protein